MGTFHARKVLRGGLRARNGPKTCPGKEKSNRLGTKWALFMPVRCSDGASGHGMALKCARGKKKNLTKWQKKWFGEFFERKGVSICFLMHKKGEK